MTITRWTVLFAGFALTGIVAAQVQQTPEQREAAAKEHYEKDLAMTRPIAAADSVWIEDLTYLEVRDAIKAGKTTALILAGSTEQNGPYLAGAKHQIVLRQTGEAIARKLGNALVAPILPIEAGNPDNKYISWGSLYLTPDTFKAVLRDMATSLKSQGFSNIILMGDSAGDTAGLKAAAQELTAKWNGTPGVYHIPEVLQLELTGCSGRSDRAAIHDRERDSGKVRLRRHPRRLRSDVGTDGLRSEVCSIGAAARRQQDDHQRHQHRAEREDHRLWQEGRRMAREHRGRGNQKGVGHQTNESIIAG